jgi:hypothetical protein
MLARSAPALLAAIITTTGNAPAALVESETLLLYNSRNDESAAIHDTYMAAHPGVQSYDLNLSYPTVPPAPRQETPPEVGLNNQYITPETFELLFGAESEFRKFITERPEILAIVTTRGLPAAVSENFDPDPVPLMIPPISGMWASFEAALSHPGIPGAGGNPLRQAPNPYFEATQGFADFLEKHCESGGPCRGDCYLITRLDSATPAEDYDQDGDIDPVDGVYAMIQRAAPLGINRYATSLVFDTNDPAFSAQMEDYRQAVADLWVGDWCVLLDGGEQFVHGPNDPNYDPDTDGLFATYPIVGLATFGGNHGGSEPIGGHYAGYYETLSYAVFNSLESGNGWSLHAPGEYAWNQGQVCDWIGLSGGTFAVGNVQEPTTNSTCRSQPLYSNFFVGGLSWGEAVYTALPDLGQYQTPLGDPLARVIAYNADVTGDRLVDLDDLSIVLAQMGTVGPEGDINEDGWVDETDLTLVQDAYGHDCSGNPLTPIPGGGVGDLNNDCVVDQEDLAILLSDYGPCPPPPVEDPNQRCISDLNGDLVVDDADLDILLAHYDTVLGDVDGNGVVNQADLDRVLAAYDTCDGDPGYDAEADLDESGCVDLMDLNLVLKCFGYGRWIKQPIEAIPIGG